MQRMFPQVFGVIPRPRVLQKLEVAIHHRVTIVSAPPGYGKTTAVSQFVQTLSVPVAWHSIQVEEHDIANLYNHALNALSLISPGIKEALPHPYGYTARELALLIAAYLADDPILQETDFFYVLDDMQLIESSTTNAWLEILIHRFPHNGHIILLSRSRPSISYIELTSRNQIAGCGMADLKLDDEEIEMLAKTTGGPLQSELIEKLDGWPAGIALALRNTDPTVPYRDSPANLFKQLANALLQEQGPALRQFLLASSTLKVMTPEGFDVLNLKDGSKSIEKIQNLNLFLSRVENGWAYHALFREFLQAQLREDDPEGFTDLHLKAGRWLETGDRIEQAFEHYATIAAHEEMAALAERVATEFFRLGKFDTLLSWDELLSRVDIPTPRLTYECALIQIDRYQHEAASENLRRAEEGFRSLGDKDGVANAQLKHGWIELRAGGYHSALTMAQTFSSSPSEIVRGNALRLEGLALLQLGQIDRSIAQLENAVPLFRSTELQPGLSHLLQDLSVAYVRKGRLDDAGNLLQEVVALRRQAGGQAALALALNNLGYHYHQQSDYEDALATLREGASIAARAFDARVESYLLWSLGDVLRDVGLYREAATDYDQALGLITADREPHLSVGLLVSKSTLHRWRGELEEALVIAERAQKIASDFASEEALARGAVWAAKAQLGAADEAITHLIAVAEAYSQQGATFELSRAWGMCAHASLLSGDQDGARDYFDRASQTAGDVRSAQMLAAEILWTPMLEAFIVRNEIRGIIRTDLNTLSQFQQSISSSYVDPGIEEPLIYLRVRTFGGGVVEYNGREVPASDWRTNRARELFFLLLFGPKTREEISLLFWPDSSTSSIRTNFHTVLGRLRDAVGKSAVVFNDDLYMINPDVPLECDVFEFERMVKRARILNHTDARAEDLWYKAVSLYQGDFLPNIDSLWAIIRRQDYQEMYLEALINLGRCSLARGDYKTTADRMEGALSVDRFSEEAYRGIMQAYAALGEKARVLETYERISTLLDSEWGVEPSDTTMNLARELLG